MTGDRSDLSRVVWATDFVLSHLAGGLITRSHRDATAGPWLCCAALFNIYMSSPLVVVGGRGEVPTQPS